MKIILKFLKKIIISCFILYGYNYISYRFNLILPINIFNILLISFLGPFGLIGLVFFKYFYLWGINGWFNIY